MIRPLDREHTEMLLQTQFVGRIGCHSESQVYIVPVTYAYSNGSIYGYSNDGQKLNMMRANPQVCFEVDKVRSYSDWQSAIAFGEFEELKGEEAALAFDTLLDRVTAVSKASPNSETDEDIEELLHHIRVNSEKGVIYRIRVRDTTGRYECKAPAHAV